MSNLFCVYAHITPNNKKYIGITKQTLDNRWKNGEGYSIQTYFYRAIQKYGWDNIRHIVLFEHLTKEEACNKEKELIEIYKTNNPNFGYNLSSGGEGPFGVIRSKETREKLRNANLGKHHTEETKRKISEHSPHYNKGKKLTPEHAEKLHKSRRGKPSWRSGRKMTDEERKKLSVAHKGQKAWNKGIPCSEEVKRKVSEANKGKTSFWKDKNLPEDVKRQISKTLSGSVWVHNNTTKHRSLIKAEELQNYLNLGYRKGKLFDD